MVKIRKFKIIVHFRLDGEVKAGGQNTTLPSPNTKNGTLIFKREYGLVAERHLAKVETGVRLPVLAHCEIFPVSKLGTRSQYFLLRD